jgi:hypothetical protein
MIPGQLSSCSFRGHKCSSIIHVHAVFGYMLTHAHAYQCFNVGRLWVLCRGVFAKGLLAVDTTATVPIKPIVMSVLAVFKGRENLVPAQLAGLNCVRWNKEFTSDIYVSNIIPVSPRTTPFSCVLTALFIPKGTQVRCLLKEFKFDTSSSIVWNRSWSRMRRAIELWMGHKEMSLYAKCRLKMFLRREFLRFVDLDVWMKTKGGLKM